jgi:hypothetical protein
MRTVDEKSATETEPVEELQHEECERLMAAFDDERRAQEWRTWRTAEFSRHRLIDRIGNVVAAVISLLFLYAALHGRLGH